MDENDGDSKPRADRIDLEFEWYRLCHGCGERKWFRAMICDDCRRQHGVLPAADP